jgi:hypothetical protein
VVSANNSSYSNLNEYCDATTYFASLPVTLLSENRFLVYQVQTPMYASCWLILNVLDVISRPKYIQGHLINASANVKPHALAGFSPNSCSTYPITRSLPFSPPTTKPSVSPAPERNQSYCYHSATAPPSRWPYPPSPTPPPATTPNPSLCP